MNIPSFLFLSSEHSFFLSPHQWTFLLSCFSSLNIHSFCLLFSEHSFFPVSYHWTFILSVILLRKHFFFSFPSSAIFTSTVSFSSSVYSFFLFLIIYRCSFIFLISDIYFPPFSHRWFSFAFHQLIFFLPSLPTKNILCPVALHTALNRFMPIFQRALILRAV